MDNFLLYALLGGLGVVIIAGPLGSVVVWKRMAYFGDTLAHAALLGVSLGVLFSWSLQISIIGVCLVLALLLSRVQRQTSLASDTWLGILAHSTLALGLVVMTYLQGVRVDLLGYLFGDILALTINDLLWIYLGGAVVLGVLWRIWKPLIAWVVDEELAKVEGVPVEKIRTLLMVLMALVIAVAMKIVGILLITSLMIIPAATARHFARTPEMMAVLAAVTGAIAVFLGLAVSFWLDIPAGPAVVVSAAGLFAASMLIPKAFDI
ncbi:MAG: metal ABC transporter permease [Gammaproteobacteria bacterium]